MSALHHTYWNGRTFDHSKRLDRVRYRWLCWMDDWRRKRFGRWLADWLCYFAVRLRGESWHVADTWHGVPGNRAAELRQNIWVNLVCGVGVDTEDKKDLLLAIDRDVTELAQAAGEAWGHVWKEPLTGREFTTGPAEGAKR